MARPPLALPWTSSVTWDPVSADLLINSVPRMAVTGRLLRAAAVRAALGFVLLTAPGAARAQDDDAPPVPQSTVETLGVLRPGSGRPDPFTFLPDTGVEPLTVVQTRPIELTGFDPPLLLTVEGGIDVVIVQNDRAFRRRRTLVVPGDVIVLSARSPLAYDATDEIVLSVGTYSTPWLISTRSQDRTPWPLSFPPVGVVAGTQALSRERTVGGFDGPLDARISGPGEPRLRVNGGPWQPAAAVNPGDRVQLTTWPETAGTQDVTLTVGELDVSWTVAAADRREGG